jgi:hypothetical protein
VASYGGASSVALCVASPAGRDVVPALSMVLDWYIPYRIALWLRAGWSDRLAAELGELSRRRLDERRDGLAGPPNQ